MPGSPAFQRLKRDLLRLVDALPAGRVTTQAAIGACLDVPPRHVAYLLARLDDAEAAAHPWHRVLREGGRLPGGGRDAQARLAADGVPVEAGRVAGFEARHVDPATLAVALEAATRPRAHRRGAGGTPALAELRGLGPQSVAWLQLAGIHSAAQLRRSDPFALYAALKARQPRVGLNLLYALIGAIEDRDWREVARTERTRILLQLDAMGLAP